jgi:1-phosphofructokinase family hexose kinase
MSGDPPITSEYDIVVVSPSLAVDSYYVLSQLRLGDVNRAEQTMHTAGGKGINMARAVKSLGGRVLLVGAVGGETGRFIAKQLDLEGISHDLIWEGQETRQSCTIVIPGQRSSTVILEAGTPLAEAALLGISERTLRYARSAPFLTLTGSLPPNVSNDFYRNLIRGIPPSLPVRVGLDTSGESLRLASNAGVRIIKVNAEEFRQAFRLVDPPDWSAIRDIYTGLVASGLQILVITSGALGALVFSPASGPFRVRTEVTDWVSTTGAGDTFMAGFLLALGRGSAIQDAARFASAASAASIQHVGCGVLEGEDVSIFLTHTSLEYLEEREISI